VFYHGSGASSRLGYLAMAQELDEHYDIATYLVDMRGHGASGGPRGDAPSIAQMYADTATAVGFVHTAEAGVPEYVGGHSAGAGLVLNSVSRIDADVSGYVFVAPDFGLHSGTEAQSDASNFATICQGPLIVNAVTGGLVDAHTYAVGFAYTKQQVASGLVPRYTTTMARAQDADGSASILAGIRKPIGVWIGSKDEVFDANAVLVYARAHTDGRAHTALVPGATHLGVLDDVAAPLGSWIDAEAA
jgi:alpha-beta hydrolase superfamily lysophospholipase